MDYYVDSLTPLTKDEHVEARDLSAVYIRAAMEDVALVPALEDVTQDNLDELNRKLLLLARRCDHLESRDTIFRRSILSPVGMEEDLSPIKVPDPLDADTIAAVKAFQAASVADTTVSPSPAVTPTKE